MPSKMQPKQQALTGLSLRSITSGQNAEKNPTSSVTSFPITMLDEPLSHARWQWEYLLKR